MGWRICKRRASSIPRQHWIVLRIGGANRRGERLRQRATAGSNRCPARGGATNRRTRLTGGTISCALSVCGNIAKHEGRKQHQGSSLIHYFVPCLRLL